MTSVTLPQEAAEEAVSTASFEELYAQYATDVLRVCYFYLGDRQRAEDVCKEKSWLLKVALNRCRDLWRGGWIKRVVLGHPAFELIPGPNEIAEAEEKQALMAAVNRLPADFKEVVLLHYYQGYGIAEIAQMLGVAEGTVSSRLSRARDKLQKLYHGEG